MLPIFLLWNSKCINLCVFPTVSNFVGTLNTFADALSHVVARPSIPPSIHGSPSLGGPSYHSLVEFLWKQPTKSASEVNSCIGVAYTISHSDYGMIIISLNVSPFIQKWLFELSSHQVSTLIRRLNPLFLVINHGDTLRYVRCVSVTMPVLCLLTSPQLIFIVIIIIILPFSVKMSYLAFFPFSRNI